jgi:hypothetical protein
MYVCVLQHEKASIAMFDHLVSVNALKPVMMDHGLVLPDDLDFIKEQIAGPQNTVLLTQGVSQEHCPSQTGGESRTLSFSHRG